MATLKMHDIELVRTDDQIPFNFDVSLATLRMPDGTIRFFHSDIDTPPYRTVFRGVPEEDPLNQLEGTFSVDFNGYIDIYPSSIWIMGIVEYEDIWIATCHREHVLGCMNGVPYTLDYNYYIGLAISRDAGLHWKYIGDVCSNVKNSHGAMANMGGCPTVRVGRWLQFFFNEFSHTADEPFISAARCDIAECAAALKEDRLPRVFKYTQDDEFRTDPMVGVGTKIIPDSELRGHDAHSQGTYCAPLGKYLVTVQTHNEGRLLMYQSNDAIHFDPEPYVIHDIGSGPISHPYSTFVAITQDDSSNDFTTIGREFYIYWPVKSTKPGEYHVDTWYRRKLSVEN